MWGHDEIAVVVKQQTHDMSFNTADTAVFLWHGLIVVRFHPAHTHTETVKPSPAIISSQMHTHTRRADCHAPRRPPRGAAQSLQAENK